MQELDFDVVLLDLDGVVYIGPHPVASAVEAIALLRAEGRRCCFVTNNASRTPKQIADHLCDLGIPTSPGDVVTSSMAAAAYLSRTLPLDAPVLVIGGPGLHEAVRSVDLRPVLTLDEEPLAVVQGYGPDVCWHDLAEAAYAVQSGLPWIATNLDRTFPTARGIAPGNGSLVAAVAAAVGRGPDTVIGKPEPGLLEEAVLRTGACRPIMVGDRLDTDVAAGSRAGIPTLLVLTGICTAADAASAQGEQRPTYVAEDLTCLTSGAAWTAQARRPGSVQP
jgi:HAD superfamily hydrolase (TIGR01457 family)